MLRMIFGFRISDQINMEKLRNEIGMFRINQLNCYHVLLEAFNIKHFGSSEKIQKKWVPENQRLYSNRRLHDVKVPKVDHVRDQGFSWYAAKLWNKLPENIKEIENPDSYKIKIKEHIWSTIPSY